MVSLQGAQRFKANPNVDVVVSEFGWAARCRQCGGQEGGDFRLVFSRNEEVERAARWAEGHEHPPIRVLPLVSAAPLTPDERERVRLLGIHRRGALRCA